MVVVLCYMRTPTIIWLTKVHDGELRAHFLIESVIKYKDN